MDVKRASDLYAQGWTLRQIGAELGVHWSTVCQHLQRAGISVRSVSPPAHPASTQQILELRDQGLGWNEIAEQVDMTVSGVWSRYRRDRRLRTSWPHLSTNSEHRVVAGATHVSLVLVQNDAAATTKAIRDVSQRFEARPHSTDESIANDSRRFV